MAKVILAGGPNAALFNPSLHVSLELLYLGAALRKVGHDVKTVDCHKCSSVSESTRKPVVQKRSWNPAMYWEFHA